MLGAGFRTVDVAAGGRVGGALRPPVRVEETVEALGAVDVVDVVVPGRLAAVVEGFLTRAASFFTTFLTSDLAGDPFSVCVSVRLASSLVDASPSAVGRGVAGFSTSAMLIDNY